MPVSSYLDTSFLVKAYLTEAESPFVEEYLRDLNHLLWISELSDLEMAATLPKRLDPADAVSTWDVYQRDRAAGLYLKVSVTAAVWSLAAEVLLRQTGPSFLGSLDALHLATALYYGANQLATFDRRLAIAAEAAGLAVVGTRP